MFAFRLALACGIWDVDGMLDKMPAGLLRRWMAYALLEPFGFPIADERHALLAAIACRERDESKFKHKPRFRQRQRHRFLTAAEAFQRAQGKGHAD